MDVTGSVPVIRPTQGGVQKQKMFLWNNHMITRYQASGGIIGFFCSIFRLLNPFSLYVKGQDTIIYKMEKSELRSNESKKIIKHKLEEDIKSSAGKVFQLIIVKKNVNNEGGRDIIVASDIPESLNNNKDFKKISFELLTGEPDAKKRVVVDEAGTFVLYEVSINRSDKHPKIVCTSVLRATGVDEATFQAKCVEFEDITSRLRNSVGESFFYCGKDIYLLKNVGSGLKTLKLDLPVADGFPTNFQIEDDWYGMYLADTAGLQKIQACKLDFPQGTPMRMVRSCVKQLLAQANASSGQASCSFIGGKDVSCVKHGDVFSFTVKEPEMACARPAQQRYLTALSVADKSTLVQEATINSQAWKGCVVGSDFYVVSCFFDTTKNSYSFAFSPPFFTSNPTMKKYFKELPQKNELLSRAYTTKKEVTDGYICVTWDEKTKKFQLKQKNPKEWKNLPFVMDVEDKKIFIEEANKSADHMYRGVMVKGAGTYLVCCRKHEGEFIFSANSITIPLQIQSFPMQKIDELCVEASKASPNKVWKVVLDRTNTPVRLTCTRDLQNTFSFELEKIIEQKPLSFQIDAQTKESLIDGVVRGMQGAQVVYDKKNTPHMVSCTVNANGSLSFSEKRIVVQEQRTVGLEKEHAYLDESIKNIPPSASKRLLAIAYQKGRADLFIPSTLENGSQSILHVEMQKRAEDQYTCLVKNADCTVDSSVQGLFKDPECTPAFFHMMVQLNTSDGPSIERMVTHEDKNYILTCTKNETNGAISFAAQPYDEQQISWRQLDKNLTGLPIMRKLIARAYNEGQSSALVAGSGHFSRVYVEKGSDGCLYAQSEEPQFFQEELIDAGVIKAYQNHDQNFFVKQLSDVVQVNALFERAKQQQQLSQKGSRKFLLYEDASKKSAVTINIKKSGEVVLGARTHLKSGSFKGVYKVNKFGLQIKKYALLQSQYAASTPQAKLLEKEARHVRAVQHPYIMRTLKGYQEKKIQTNLGEESVLAYKNVFYGGGDARQLDGKNISGSLEQVFSQLIDRLQVVLDIAKSLQYLHSGVVDADGTGIRAPVAHMDIKPDNIFLVKEDERMKGILGDINLQQVGSQGAVVSPLYLPPENRFNNLTTTGSDIWALGLTLFELTHGEFPLNIQTHWQLDKHVDDQLQKNQNPIVDAVLQKMLEIDPAKRIHAADLVKELENAIHLLKDTI